MQAAEQQAVLTPIELDLLMVHLVRSRLVTSTALDKLLPEHFFNPFELHYYLLWGVVSGFFRTYKANIPQPMLRAEIYTFLTSDPSYQPFAEPLNRLIDLAYTFAESDLMPEPVIKGYLQKLLNARVFQAAISSLDPNLDPEAAYNQTKQAFERSRITAATRTNIFRFDESELAESHVPATATGSAVFDKLTIGGMRPKHLTGLLAPFGGGKTMCQIETAVQAARQRIPVTYFSYEQPVVLLRPRVWSCATGLSTKMLTETLYKDLSADVKGKIKALEYVEDYLQFVDMQLPTVGSDGVQEAAAVLSRFRTAGFHSQLVCFDWLGVMVRRYCNSRQLTQSGDIYSTYASFLTEMRYSIANDMNCEVFVTHQLNADAGGKGPAHRASMYDASEFKHFAALMDTCLIIGKASANGIALVFNAKNRGAKDECNVQLMSDVCRFKIVGSGFLSMTDDSGRELLINPNGTGAEGELNTNRQLATAGFE